MSAIYDDWCTHMQNFIRVYLEIPLQNYYTRIGIAIIFIRSRGHPYTGKMGGFQWDEVQLG